MMIKSIKLIKLTPLLIENIILKEFKINIDIQVCIKNKIKNQAICIWWNKTEGGRCQTMARYIRTLHQGENNQMWVIVNHNFHMTCIKKVNYQSIQLTKGMHQLYFKH